MPQLSIIIPVYNAEKTLALCLAALEKQTIAKDCYEIIVIDDGSTDLTATIAKKYSITYHFQENQGPAAARNKGVSLVKNKTAEKSNPEHLIFFTDADCIPNQDWLEKMTAPFSRPEVTAVKGAYRSEQNSIVARFAQLEFEERFAMLAKRDSIDMVDTYSAGFRKDIFQSLGGFDSRFPVANNEDTELSYRMAEQGYIMVFAPEAVVRHLNHPDSIKRYFQLKFSRGYWRMIVYRMFPDKMIKDSYTPQTLKLQIIGLFLISASLFFLPFFPAKAGIICIAAVLFFLLQALPFTLAAFKKDAIVACLSPLLLALRAAAIGSGALWGVFSRRNLQRKRAS